MITLEQRKLIEDEIAKIPVENWRKGLINLTAVDNNFHGSIEICPSNRVEITYQNILGEDDVCCGGKAFGCNNWKIIITFRSHGLQWETNHPELVKSVQTFIATLQTEMTEQLVKLVNASYQ